MTSWIPGSGSQGLAHRTRFVDQRNPPHLAEGVTLNGPVAELLSFDVPTNGIERFAAPPTTRMPGVSLPFAK